MTTNILGTEYIIRADDLNCRDLAANDGICYVFDKEIIVRQPQYHDGLSQKTRIDRFDHVMLHELIHAYAQESGVQYGNDEALVEWVATMIPHICRSFKDIKEQMRLEHY